MHLIYLTLCNQKQKGFTLIELVAVMMLIAVMSVTIAPKFFNSTGFEEHTYRDELITKFRAIQVKAMQQTNIDVCHLVSVKPDSIGLLATINGACGANYAANSTTVTVNSSHQVNFSTTEGINSFSFSSLGKPVGCIAVTPCEISFSVNGASSLLIKINAQGYIYAL